MRKYWWLALVLVLVMAVPAVASQAVKIYINGQELKSDVPAQIIDGRTMVPLRAISENLGKTVNWDAATRTVNISGLTELQKAELITAEWAAGGHNSLIANPAGRANCVDCHTGIGFLMAKEAVKYDPTKEDAPLKTTIGCDACHTGRGKALMDAGEVTGLAFAPQETFKAGKGAVCLPCHDARRNTTQVYKDSVEGKLVNLTYPHYGPAAMTTGKGGLQIPGVTYASSAAHANLPDACVSCHLPKTKDGYKQHKFKMDIAYIGQTCGSCHRNITTYNLNGFQDEIKVMMKKVHDAAVAAVPGAVKIGTGSGRLQFQDADGKEIPRAEVSHEAFVAGYNYYLVKSDGSYGVHNPKYAKALLQESYKLLTGKNL